MLRIDLEIQNLLKRYEKEKGVFRNIKDHPDIKKLRPLKNFSGSISDWRKLIKLLSHRKQRVEHLSYKLIDDLTEAIFNDTKAASVELNKLDETQQNELAKAMSELGSKKLLTPTNCLKILRGSNHKSVISDIHYANQLLGKSEDESQTKTTPTISSKARHIITSSPIAPANSPQRKSSAEKPDSSLSKAAQARSSSESINPTHNNRPEFLSMKQLLEEKQSSSSVEFKPLSETSHHSSAVATTYDQQSQKSIFKKSSSSSTSSTLFRKRSSSVDFDEAASSEEEVKEDAKAYIKGSLDTLLALNQISKELHAKALQHPNSDKFLRKIKALINQQDLNAESLEKFLTQNSKKPKL